MLAAQCHLVPPVLYCHMLKLLEMELEMHVPYSYFALKLRLVHALLQHGRINCAAPRFDSTEEEVQGIFVSG